MIVAKQSVIDMINSPVRKIIAKVEVYDSTSTLVDTFAYDDKLVEVSIERVGEEHKFFGFGICQKLNIKLRDLQREVDYITPQHTIKVMFGTATEYVNTLPTFYVTQTRRDENTNELTIYGYDLIFDASKHYTGDLPISAPYSPLDLAAVCADTLGASGIRTTRLSEGESCFTKLYDEGANFEGTESLRDALDAIAEVTQTIYYVDADNYIVFKRLDKDAPADLELTKDKYFSLSSGDSRRLATICHTTELGDNISASTIETGTTQYVRDNAFWTLLESTEIAAMIDTAVATVGGLTINQFECEWRGNFLLEIGDKISLSTKDDNKVMSFLLDDTIQYTGVFKGTTKFSYNADDTETANNPSTIGEALNQTFAKVDKVNKTIQAVVSDISENESRISALEMDTDSISMSVSQVQSSVNDSLNTMGGSIEELTKKLETTITSDAVDIKIQQAIDNGATSVKTETGFTFNENGLNISKSGSEMSTEVTEDGMVIKKNNTPVLTASNQGVDAENLHATTYLIIGKYSRFEDYGYRTGCFWIG